MSEQKDDRYARADVQGGYLYNQSEIDYFKQTQMVDVMANLMLGDFNKKGNYILDKAMVLQLVKLKKIYQYSFGSTTFCQSANDIAGYGKIDFAIKVRSNTQNGTVSATLQLLETIDRANGYYQNTNSAPIAVYVAPESNTYIVDMLKYFNVVSKKDEGLLKKDQRDEDIDLIVARKKYEEFLKDATLPKIDDLNKNLYEKRLKILAKSVIGKKILEEFSKESYKINGWFVKEGMPGYYRYLNQVLDGLVELYSAQVLQDVALKAAWNKYNENFGKDLAGVVLDIEKKAVAQSHNEEIVKQFDKAKNAEAPKQENKPEENKEPAKEPKKEDNKVEKAEKKDAVQDKEANTSKDLDKQKADTKIDDSKKKDVSKADKFAKLDKSSSDIVEETL